MKKFVVLLAFVLMALLFVGCAPEADMASYNISKSADQFEVTRRIVFINGITDEYLLVIEGLCSLGNYDNSRELSVTCKTGPSSYKKHFLGLSDNVTYVAEQLDSISVDPYHYRTIFRPESILPYIDLEVSP